MTERAAHLVDHVFPDVPVRQWVLSLPLRIRYLLAWHHDLCKALVGVLFREVNRHLRDRARARGLVDPRGGAVAVVQRFGGALNVNVHFHVLVLDGVFARAEDGRLAFHATPSLTEADVADVLAAIAPGVTRLLARRGFGDGADGDRSDTFAEATPLLAGLAAASVQGVGSGSSSSIDRRRLAVRGHRLGRRVLRQIATVVMPDTILRRHRQLIARKWTYAKKPSGRCGVLAEIRRLLCGGERESHLRLHAWGYTRIQGALKNVGHRLGRSIFARILNARGLPAVPALPTSWLTFLARIGA